MFHLLGGTTALYGVCSIIFLDWALGSAVERFPDKKEVDGPTPSAPTDEKAVEFGGDWVGDRIGFGGDVWNGMVGNGTE